MLEEFKKFALRGNVVDLAVGVIIGAAFGAIVSSAVGDIIMPVIGAITGGLDFSNYYTPLTAAVKTGLPLVDAKKAGAVLAYGSFITATLNFLIIAFVLFIAIQGINRMKKKEEAQPPGPTATEKLLAEIRDAEEVTGLKGRELSVRRTPSSSYAISALDISCSRAGDRCWVIHDRAARRQNPAMSAMPPITTEFCGAAK